MAKKTLSQAEDMQKKIELAQEAVSKMADESLKAIAFQTVLQRLLLANEMPGMEGKKASEVGEPSKPEAKPRSKQPKGIKGRVEELITEGFFTQKRTLGEVKEELERHGWFHPSTDLSPTLLGLVKDKKLRRIKEPENEGGKLVWRYSNW